MGGFPAHDPWKQGHLWGSQQAVPHLQSKGGLVKERRQQQAWLQSQSKDGQIQNHLAPRLHLRFCVCFRRPNEQKGLIISEFLLSKLDITNHIVARDRTAASQL